MGIRIEPGVFAEIPDGTRCNEHVMIITSEDPASAEAALAWAAARFYCVTEDGRELSPDSLSDTDEAYTPNYVSHVCLAQRGPYVYVDCKSQISLDMPSRFLAILHEELDRAGIKDALVIVPSADEI